MDQAIPRRTATRYLHVDSAYRSSSETPAEYRVVMDSHDHYRARRVKDVISLSVTRMSLPIIHDNIIAGGNIVNFHVVKTSAVENATRITSEGELRTFLTNSSLTPSIDVQSSIDGMVLSASENSLLISPAPLAGFEMFECDGSEPCYVLLVSKEGVAVTFTYPLQLVCAENHRLLLKPGYYPTSTMVISELMECFEGINSQVESDLQYTQDWSSTDAGWSVYKEPRGRWVLYYRSQSQHLNMFFSMEPQGHNVLRQLGLRDSAPRNWAEPTTMGNTQSVFMMARGTVAALGSAQNTIINRAGSGTAIVGSLYQLQFEQMNMTPRRYVDVIIQNVPSPGVMSNGPQHSNTFARIYTSSHKISYASSSQGDNEQFDESSLSDTYVHFENQFQEVMHFAPLALDHLLIRLVDNLGYPYNTNRDHSMEIRMTVLSDAIAEFEQPMPSLGSTGPKKRRELRRMPKYPGYTSRGEQRRSKAVEVPAPPHWSAGIVSWASDNRIEIATSLATFSAVMYTARKFRMWSQPPAMMQTTYG